MTPRAMERALWLALACLASACEDPDFSRPDAAGVVAPPLGGTVAPAPDAALVGGTPNPGGATVDAALAPADAATDPDDGLEADTGPPVTPPTQPPTAAPPTASIVGVWVSQGDDVAALLAGPGVNVVRLDVEFRADGTFTASYVDRDDRVAEFAGRYQTDTRSDPYGIVLDQSMPQTVRSEGIWRLESVAPGRMSAGDVLTYEVAQTQPPLNGVSAPTPSAGFGSTSAGDFGTDNVQTYRRVVR
ncbi:MAG: hypothetical protein ACOYM9_13245 [Bradymonadia bacterium]